MLPCLLAAIAAFCFASQTPAASPKEDIVFPTDANLVDVTQPPYNMKGDGKTDNTSALQKAFIDNRGTSRTLYFPNGTYLLSDRVNISGDQKSKPHSPHRFLNIQGQSRDGTIIKLKADSPGFDNPRKPKTFISLYEGKSTGDVMHSYIRNITVEVGPGNPGAAALRFMTNNSGAMYDVLIRSTDPDKRGAIGLDLRQGQNGPGLIKRVTVDGFDYGIETANTFSLVFEDITTVHSRKAGFNAGNSRLTIANFQHSARCPAFRSAKHTQLTLIGGRFDGKGCDASALTVSADPKTFLRDVTVTGYAHTVRADDGTFVDGNIDEWYQGKGESLFGNDPTTLRLPIKPTPEIPWETDLSKWVKVDPGNDTLQAALDTAAEAGHTTVYFPKLDKNEGKYVLTQPVRIHGSVNRVIGMENILWLDEAIPPGQAAIIFDKDLGGPVVFERFFNILKNGSWKGLMDRFVFENHSPHPVVIRNVGQGAGKHKKPAPGKEWFIEDVAGARQCLIGPGESCWARQYDPESPDIVMIEVDGGSMWILGLKTEGRSTHIIARNGAKVELLGGVSYQSWRKQELDPPMFIVEDSAASFTFGFYHWNKPFTTIVSETIKGTHRTLLRDDLAQYHLPAYRAGAGGSNE
jgi:hypothetical protein